MNLRKTGGLLLAAAIAGSGISLSVSARDNIPAEELSDYISSGTHTFAACGDFTGWNVTGDIILSDADGDGMFIGYVRDIPEGTYKFKIRADGSWDDNWGAYNAMTESTYNSHDDYYITVGQLSDVFIIFDATKNDPNLWSISTLVAADAQPSAFSVSGTMNDWGELPDYPMYEVAPGRFVGIAIDCPFGEQQFGVRCGSDLYAAYDARTDSTKNSPVLCTTDIPGSGDIMVELDTHTPDSSLYAVSFAVKDTEGVISDEQFTGRDHPILPSYFYTSEDESSSAPPSSPERSGSQQSQNANTSRATASEPASQTAAPAANYAQTAAAATGTAAAPVTNVPKTGDDSVAAVWIFLSIIGLGTAAFAVYRVSVKL